MSQLREPLLKAGAKERRGQIDVPVGVLYFPPKGDKLQHPRSGDPLRVSLRDLIVVNGYDRTKPIIVWQQIAKGGEVTIDGSKLKKGEALFIVCDGSGRGHAAYAAQPILLKAGKLKKGWVDLMVPVELFEPTSPETAEKEFLLLRQKCDSDPEKSQHVLSVIAFNYIAAKKVGATLEEMLATAPRHYTKGIINALLRWPELHPKAAKAFDEGLAGPDGQLQEVPVGLLPALLDKVSRDEHPSSLAVLVSDGYTSHRGASRALGAEAARAEDAAEDEQESADSKSDSANKTGSNGASGSNGSGAAARGPRVGAIVQAVRPKMISKSREHAAGKANCSPEEAYFWLGATAGVGAEDDLKLLTKQLDGMAPQAKHLLAGILYRWGYFKGPVQKHVQPGVLETIAKMSEPTPKPPAKSEVSKEKGRRLV